MNNANHRMATRLAAAGAPAWVHLTNGGKADRIRLSDRQEPRHGQPSVIADGKGETRNETRTMKNLLLTIVTFLMLGTHLLGSNQVEMDDFTAKLQAALSAKDIKALNDCFFWGNTPQPLQDLAIWEFEEILRENDFLSIDISTLDDNRFNQGHVKLYSSGKVMNGRHYNPNLKPILMSIIFFKDPSCPTCALIHKWIPIGITPEGKYRIPGTEVFQE